MAADPHPARWHLAAFLLYATSAFAFIDHGVPLTGRVLGSDTDPFLIMWFLAWWPWALAHHVYPLFTDMVWQPLGQNLGWTTSVPLLALLGLPATLLSGPVLAFNLLTLAAPVLAALATYALCLNITRDPAAALLGGWLFGFSSYEMAQANSHLNLDFTVFVPLLLLLVLLRCQDRLGRVGFALAAGFSLAAQFCASLELCATMLLFGFLGWLCAIRLWPTQRAVLVRLVADGLAAGLLAILLVSPVLYAMFALKRDIHLPPHWPQMFSTDLLNLVVPTITTLIGGGALAGISQRFTGFPDEQDAYFGFLLLLLLGLHLLRRRRQAPERLLATMFALIVLLSLGPELWLAGVKTKILLPWAAFAHLPFIGNALPARFMVYAWLLAALIAARAIAAASPGPARRRTLIFFVLGCVFLIPYPHPTQAVPDSAFFKPGRVEAVLGRGAKIMILPWGITGPSSFWQADEKFGFRQTGGYLGYPPGALQHDKPMMRFYFGLDSPGLAHALAAYCRATGTQYVVAGPGTPPWALKTLAVLGWPAQTVDDVIVFQVPGK